MDKSDSKMLQTLTEEMDLFRSQMEAVDIVAVRVAAKTNRIIKWVLTMLAISSLFLVFLVYSMSNYLTVMLGHLDDMYSEFGVMSENMQVITRSVESIGDNINGMPVIAKNMNFMSADLRGMVGSVKDISFEMSGMEKNTGLMGTNTNEMSHRFVNLNRAVNHIGYNVNQMGKPMP